LEKRSQQVLKYAGLTLPFSTNGRPALQKNEAKLFAPTQTKPSLSPFLKNEAKTCPTKPDEANLRGLGLPSSFEEP
jgi:hypothetical protein